MYFLVAKRISSKLSWSSALSFSAFSRASENLKFCGLPALLPERSANELLRCNSGFLPLSPIPTKEFRLRNDVRRGVAGSVGIEFFFC
jgi:hypothetical protein